MFNDTSRYIKDILTIDIQEFETHNPDNISDRPSAQQCNYFRQKSSFSWLKGKSAYCLCASKATHFYYVSRNVSSKTSQHLGTAVIFPAILVLRHRSNFIGVRFIKIADCLSESGESVTSHTCFLKTIIFEKKLY